MKWLTLFSLFLLTACDCIGPLGPKEIVVIPKPKNKVELFHDENSIDVTSTQIKFI